MHPEIRIGRVVFVKGAPETRYSYVALVTGRPHRARVKPLEGGRERQVPTADLVPFTRGFACREKATPR